MTKYFAILSVFILLLLLASCATATKIAAMKPEPDDASPLVYDNVPSVINLPISLKIKDIENQTNKLLKDLIYEDNDIEDDNIEMKVWKQAPITIVNKDQKLEIILPLKAVVKYRIGTKTLGVALYNTKEFNLNGNITLASVVSLNNWKLMSKTELKSLDWNESPSMVVLGKNVPVTYLINPAVQLFRSKIEKNIDLAIEKSMDFKPNVLEALEKVCTPFLMDENYQSWLQVVPLEIYSTNAKLKEQSFVMDMGIKCNIITQIGTAPSKKFDASKIALKPVSQIPNMLSANVAAISTYKEAAKIINKNFAGQEFVSGSKKVKVLAVDVWHKNGKMVVALDLEGSVTGTIYLTGVPKYDSKTKELYFDNMDYALDTKNKIMKTANWLAQGLILKKIEQNCRYSIANNLEEGKQSMAKYLKNYSPMPGVFVNGKINNLTFESMQLANQAIIAFVKINGAINIAIDGLK